MLHHVTPSFSLSVPAVQSFFLSFFFFCRNRKLLFHTEISSEISEHLKILQASIREYFPSARNDVSWLEYPFSASTEYLDRQRTEVEHLADMAPDGNLIDILKTERLCLNFGLCVEGNTQKLQIILFNSYCILFQHTPLRQHCRNRPSLRTIKEADLILKHSCRSSYLMSNLTLETDT